MEKERSKLCDLTEAIERFVFAGAHISIGGFTLNRNPMAAVHEIIRQGHRDLHFYAHSNGQGMDELAGAGSIARIEIAYAGNGRFAPTCIRFRKAVQEGKIQVEDYSNYQMTLRFMAGAMGVPFLPCRSALGAGFQAYLQTYVTGVADHAELIEKIGSARIGRIKADPHTGYAKEMDRR